MTDPGRLRLLATFVAGVSLDVAEAPGGQPAHTDGQTVFVTAGGSPDRHRREMLVQSALLGAGSLAPGYTRTLRARPSTARRYLALEGRRALTDLAERLPLAASLVLDGGPCTAGAAESLALARSRKPVDDPPDWFGVIRPRAVVSTAIGLGAPSTGDEEPTDEEETGDEDEPGGKSTILRLFEAPVSSQALSEFLRKLFGGARSHDEDAAGGDLRVGSVRQVQRLDINARPAPTRIRFTGTEKPGAAVGLRGAVFPEWDVHQSRYRPDWCRVIDFPLVGDIDVSAAAVAQDAVLRQRLGRVRLGLRRLRARADGDELDTEALIAMCVDLRAGYSPPDNVYLERRKLDRNLGVLVLVDASGSATDADPDGLAVHEHQRRAAAILTATLEELGDRVAVYAFRSHGRDAVHLPAIKTFEQRFGAAARARLNQLQPSGYTRLGAAVRGAGEILKSAAGTPNRLLVVLSDGYPYDYGYEGRYAEADAQAALGELRADGVACLCLSVGAGAGGEEFQRVFGATCNAAGASLSELSPRMDELFISALRELAYSRPHG